MSGFKLSELLYANTTALVAHTEVALQCLTSCFAEADELFGLEVSLKKTEVSYEPAPQEVFHHSHVIIVKRELKSVQQFNYLGNIISSDVDPETLWDLLLQLDPYKSMEPDGIHPRILKELADVIAKPLLVIFEQFLESGEVSADWKLTNIVPIFKKSKKEDLRNYRPVSLT
ncbi:hypothetical protein BTVI_24604 [Pitangus sulphuratus]|nr:hypothetical protein BTVI_24604 [Pitangus sulphuratus]